MHASADLLSDGHIVQHRDFWCCNLSKLQICPLLSMEWIWTCGLAYHHHLAQCSLDFRSAKRALFEVLSTRSSTKRRKNEGRSIGKALNPTSTKLSAIVTTLCVLNKKLKKIALNRDFECYTAVTVFTSKFKLYLYLHACSFWCTAMCCSTLNLYWKDRICLFPAKLIILLNTTFNHLAEFLAGSKRSADSLQFQFNCSTVEEDSVRLLKRSKASEEVAVSNLGFLASA